jgi:hypothetical protein
MTRNVGRIDQVLRILVGLGILSLAFVGPKTPLGYFGLLPLLTGMLGVCPAYALFGYSTCPAPTDRAVQG